MNKKIFLAIFIPAVLAILTLPLFLSSQNITEAQIKKDDDSFFMMGTIEKEKIMTGVYSKNSEAIHNKNWCVFVGENGKVYKISLIDKSIHALSIDGKKIEDKEIWKHNAEYKPFLEKFWRETELENQSAEIDSLIKPFDRKISVLDKEIEKLDKREAQLEKGASSFDDSRKSINAERKKLAKMQNEYAQQIEQFSDRQEAISKELESLNLMAEIDKVLLQICEDLKSIGVVKTSKGLSFKLNNSVLMVNGKQVSPEAHQLLKDKYIVDLNGEFGFLYHWKKDL